jgi:hypothetical protein
MQIQTQGNGAPEFELLNHYVGGGALLFSSHGMSGNFCNFLVKGKNDDSKDSSLEVIQSTLGTFGIGKKAHVQKYIKKFQGGESPFRSQYCRV